MDIELKWKKPKNSWKTRPFPIPVDAAMEAELKELKKAGIDLNQMARDYFQMLIDRYKTEEKCS